MWAKEATLLLKRKSSKLSVCFQSYQSKLSVWHVRCQLKLSSFWIKKQDKGIRVLKKESSYYFVKWLLLHIPHKVLITSDLQTAPYSGKLCTHMTKVWNPVLKHCLYLSQRGRWSCGTWTWAVPFLLQ